MLKIAIVAISLSLALSAPLAYEALAGEPAGQPETEEIPGEAELIQEDEEVTREDLLETLSEVHGKRGRRIFKAAYWAAGLESDMKKIYDTYGYPSSRYREEKAGVMLEKWTYLDAGKQFVFRDNRLTKTKRFNPGSAVGIYLK
jgi:hypothetical protein